MLFSVPHRALAQSSSDDLFKKVFGKSSNEEKSALIDASLGDFFIGEVGVVIVGEKIIKISSSDLKRILNDKIRETQLVKYNLGEGDVDPEVLPFKITYHASELRVSILIPPEDLRPSDANVYDDLTPYYSRKASESAPVSMGLNYKLEQSFNKKTNQEDAFSAQTDAFLNIKKVAFENQMQYLSTRQNNKWARQPLAQSMIAQIVCNDLKLEMLIFQF